MGPVLSAEVEKCWFKAQQTVSYDYWPRISTEVREGFQTCYVHKLEQLQAEVQIEEQLCIFKAKQEST